MKYFIFNICSCFIKVNKEFIDKNFSTIHLSFLQTIVFRQSFINHNLGGAVDSCIIQIVCWHHLTSLLNDNLKNESTEFQRALHYWNNSFGVNFSTKKLTLTSLSELSAIPLETVRRRVIQLEKLSWVKYSPKTGVVYSPSEENNNLIVEINEKEKEMQANYLNICEKAKNLPLQ